MKKKEIDLRLQGEIQKAVWSLIWNRKQMRSGDITKHLQYAHGSISNALKRLIEIGAVEMIERGLYKVSDKVTK